MAGDIFGKDSSPITLTSVGSSLTTGTAGIGNGSAALDLRAASTAGNKQDLRAVFDFICQWSTITSIAAGTQVADLFLLPSVDDTNFPDIDTTSGSSYLPYNLRVDSLFAPKAPTANTNMRFTTAVIRLMPVIYKPYIVNRSGQTILANWSLVIRSARLSYS